MFFNTALQITDNVYDVSMAKPSDIGGYFTKYGTDDTDNSANDSSLLSNNALNKNELDSDTADNASSNKTNQDQEQDKEATNNNPTKEDAEGTAKTEDDKTTDGNDKSPEKQDATIPVVEANLVAAPLMISFIYRRRQKNTCSSVNTSNIVKYFDV